MKIKIDNLAGQLGTTVNDLLQLKEKLTPEQWSGRGKNTWFTEDAVDILCLALEIPEIVPNRTTATVLYEARNPNYIFCTLSGKEGKVPVCIPRHLKNMIGRLLGKRITIEVITDERGTSYRYVK